MREEFVNYLKNEGVVLNQRVAEVFKKIIMVKKRLFLNPFFA